MTLAALAVLMSQPATVFSSPSDGYDTFRIPALAQTRKGTLLAFAEGRQSQADAAGNHIVLRRSTDNGKNWQPIQTIGIPHGGSFNNPTVVVLPDGKILLHFQHYPANTHEYDVEPGLEGPKTVQAFQIASTDDGANWSEPTNITAQVKNPATHTLASGPGIGIVLEQSPNKGRIVVPYNRRVGQRWSVFMAFSDDGGRTWIQGGTVPASPEYQPNEVQVVELANGHLMLNCRNQAKGKFRLVADSPDQGLSWFGAHPNPDLPDPTCQASIIRLSWQPSILAFSNPASTKGRSQGTLRLSLDEGANWLSPTPIESGSFQYSCLCPMANGSIGILYEHVDSDRYQVRFRRARVTDR